jgi:xylulokinase
MQRSGKELSTQAVGPKILWVRRHEPEVYARARRWFSSHSYVIARLTGEYVLDHHTASQCDPLYDLHRRAWARDWAEEIAPWAEASTPARTPLQQEWRRRGASPRGCRS